MSYNFYLDLNTVNILLFNTWVFFSIACLDQTESLLQADEHDSLRPFVVAIHEG